ncbi:MAG: flagellar hook-length control protein FliK [Mesorhizobium sp.]|nr:flagellar hook-length control protein FliK [Mesorhizobium sp.]
MNLPANLPINVASASSTRADRQADQDAAGLKFDDVLQPKKAKASSDTRAEQGDKQTNWSWTRLDLAKSRMGWQVEADPAKGGEAADLEAGEPSTDLPEDLAADDATVEDETSEVESGVRLGLEADQVDAKPDPRGETRVNIDGNAPEEPTEETDEDAAQRAALAAERVAGERPVSTDMPSRTPVQGDGEARQGAALAAVDDRRAETRIGSRERAALAGDRVPDTVARAEPAMRDAPRPTPIAGNTDRLAQSLNADAKQADGRVPDPLKSGASLREDNLRSDPFAQRVTVVSSQTAPITPPTPAPASLGLSSPSLQVTAAIREDVGQISRAAAAQIEAQNSAGSRNRPVHTLQIQLQPADLGRVNARMSIDGSQLRVELQVETEQARAALAKDADAILKSLKASGFDIDRVTIQQVQPASNSNPAGTAERNANSFASQGNGADESGGQGGQGGTGSGDGQAPQGGYDGVAQNDSRGGVFI